MLNEININQKEFGDFQTPFELTNNICKFLSLKGIKPFSILEPTCGEGNFIISSLNTFTYVYEIIGNDISTNNIKKLKIKLNKNKDKNKVHLFQGDFFIIDWKSIIKKLPQPILIIGNPPWVTNSDLAILESKNLPEKKNFRHFSGFDAMTGKSNFDISEWMLLHILEWINGNKATVAQLCKTEVARKVLLHAWQKNISLDQSQIYLIDAKKYFGVSVDACLLICNTTIDQVNKTCKIYNDINEDTYKNTFGFRDNKLIANIEYYDELNYLQGDSIYRWRSGIKHDCSKIVELERVKNGYKNKLGKIHDLENTYLYPMYKSSDIAKQELPKPFRWMLVTQKYLGEDTKKIADTAPKTWAYLNYYNNFFKKRKSRVYKKQPSFSFFGVGEYSFAPWKVAISAMYKKIHFNVVGPYEGKPTVLDDTCYFIPCKSKNEAQYLKELLNTKIAKRFYESFIFWDSKRPIKIDILKRLNIAALEKKLMNKI